MALQCIFTKHAIYSTEFLQKNESKTLFGLGLAGQLRFPEKKEKKLTINDVWGRAHTAIRGLRSRQSEEFPDPPDGLASNGKTGWLGYRWKKALLRLNWTDAEWVVFKREFLEWQEAGEPIHPSSLSNQDSSTEQEAGGDKEKIEIETEVGAGEDEGVGQNEGNPEKTKRDWWKILKRKFPCLAIIVLVNLGVIFWPHFQEKANQKKTTPEQSNAFLTDSIEVFEKTVINRSFRRRERRRKMAYQIPVKPEFPGKVDPFRLAQAGSHPTIHTRSNINCP